MPGFSWLRRRSPLPPALLDALDPQEQVQLVARLVGGDALAVSRFGLWLVSGEVAVRWNWDRVTKARLAGTTLAVIAAEEVAVTGDGTVLLTDLPAREFELASTSKLTDAVHARVRRSVAASRHLPWPGAGGWVVLRRVSGCDGVIRQVRLDPGSDAHAAGFLAAVAEEAAQLEAELHGG